jgi:hypothetical protein
MNHNHAFIIRGPAWFAGTSAAATLRRAGVLAPLLVVWTHAVAFADNRPSNRLIIGQTSIYLPITRYSMAESLKEIAAGSNLLVGFEAVADPHETGNPPPHFRAWSITGLLVSQALDMLTAADERYGWREVDGVINVRPKMAFDDPNHFLHHRVKEFKVRDALPIEVTFAVHRLFRSSCEITHPIYGEDRDTFVSELPLLEQVLVTFEARNTTVLQILNGFIRMHGALHWNVSYPAYQATYEPKYERSNFGFSSVPVSGGWWRMCVGD